ncbi:MAG: DNA polymerase III subunit epsilon [Aestuariivirga sp.]
MREIVLDTETTGLDPAQGHRMVEIGALELINHVATGKTFHAYINPERDMPKEAEAVHGLTTSFLRPKPVFASVVIDFLAFIGDAPLVIHNAAFDTAFLNAELSYCKLPTLLAERIVDTLQIARKRHPMGPNSLDALCKRYGIDNSKRTKHGALLDSELLAEVYLELIGGRQTALTLATSARSSIAQSASRGIAMRPQPLPPRITEAEREAHRKLIAELGEAGLWPREA